MLVVLNGPNIAAEESLSDALDVSAGAIVKITMPTIEQGWNGSEISFESSSDGIGFNPLFYNDGAEVIYHVHAGTGIIVPRLTLGWIKIRSGTRDRPVEQHGLRTFAVALDVVEAAAPAEDELTAALLQLRTVLDRRYKPTEQ